MKRCRPVLALCVLLTACLTSRVGTPPDIAELRFADETFPGFYSTTQRSLYDNGKLDDGSDAPPNVVRAMETAGIRSAAQYRTVIDDADGATTLRARVEVYADAASARPRFRDRHLPQALATTDTLDLGDDAFAFRNAYLGVLVGPVIVEIRADPPHPALRPFAAVYVRQIENLLRR